MEDESLPQSYKEAYEEILIAMDKWNLTPEQVIIMSSELLILAIQMLPDESRNTYSVTIPLLLKKALKMNESSSSGVSFRSPNNPIFVGADNYWGLDPALINDDN